MPRHDRLSALIARFTLKVAPAGREEANLIVLEGAERGVPSRVVLSTKGPLGPAPYEGDALTFSALAEWGGRSNPLFAALPDRVELEIGADRETSLLVQLLKAEGESRRCGSEAVLDRLGEVLMVRLLRAQIERGNRQLRPPGRPGGPAPKPRDRRRARGARQGLAKRGSGRAGRVVAQPLRRALRPAIVGISPMAYLRRWRMDVLARQDIERGERIQTVARRYGYGSSEALNRSFRRHFGETPMRLRKLAAR